MTMPNPLPVLGQGVTVDLIAQVDEMTSAEKTWLVAQMVESADGFSAEALIELGGRLTLFFKHPDRYQHVPGRSGSVHQGKPLPYEGRKK